MIVTQRKTPRPRKARITDWTDGHREFLKTGFAFFTSECPGFFEAPDGLIPHGTAPNMEAVREAWDCLRVEILRDWLQAHPGTRPRYWWEIDAPEPRRRMLRGPKRLYAADQPDGWWYGVPSRFEDFHHEIVFESQAAYLQRHGLLSDAERAVLGRIPAEEIVLSGPLGPGRTA